MEEQGRWKCVGLLCLRFSGLFKYAQGVREKYRRLKQRWHKETCACGDCLFSGVAGMGGTMSFVFRKDNRKIRFCKIFSRPVSVEKYRNNKNT